MSIIKKTISSIIYSINSIEYEDLFKKVEDAETVSFDVFDTLLKRNVKTPEDIFVLVEKSINTKYNINQHFKDKRIQAEKESRTKLNKDVNLEEIYSFLELEKKEEYMNLEKRFEFEFCCPNKSVVSIYNKCIKQQKKVYLISDMYLSSDFIKSVLDKCGIRGFRNLYVSNEVGKTKAKGDLFDYVKNINEIQGKWVHVGDSIKGDFFNGKRYGITTFLIKRNNYFSTFYKSNNCFELNQLKAFVANNEPHNISCYEKIGYEILGPLLCGFSKWLYEETTKDRVTDILFLARDSFLLKKTFEILYPQKINNVYFYISRKAALNSILSTIQNYNELHDLFVPKDSDTVSDLYKALSINSEEQFSINSALGIDNTTLVNSDLKFDTEYFFKLLRHYINERDDKQGDLLLKYLDQNKISDSFAVVDIGWEGRTQWALDRLISSRERRSNIKGYYFGIIKKYPKLTQNLSMKAFIGRQKNTDIKARVIMESIALFETLFLGNEGSTLRYQEKNGIVIPVKGEPDQAKNNLSKVREIQTGALMFVRHMAQSHSFFDSIYWSADFTFDIYKYFAVYPDFKRVKLLRGLQFSDRDSNIFGSKHSILYYIAHLKSFKTDLMRSYYRVLFLKDVLKLPLPYFEMLYRYYYKKHKKG